MVSFENKKVLIGIILLGFILRIYTASDFYLHEWDECYHALVSKHLMSDFLNPVLYKNPILNYNYTSWTSNNIWLHKQPMALWLIAISFKLFGVNEIALRLPSIITSTACIYLVYKIAIENYNKKVALIAAFLFSTNGFIIELVAGRVATDHIDSIFLFFILCSIYLTLIYSKTYQLRYLILIGMFIGTAILTKWLPALIVIPIWLYLTYDMKFLFRTSIHFLILIIIISCVALPWQFYIMKQFPIESSWEYSYNSRHFFEVIESHSGNIFYYLDKIRINYGEMIYIPLFWVFYNLAKNKLEKKEIYLLIWFLIPLIFFSVAKTKMPAYILFTSPALFIYFGLFYDFLRTHKNNSIRKLSSLFIIIISSLSIRYCVERIKPFSSIDRNPNWISQIKTNHYFNKSDKNIVLLNFKKPIDIMFYSDITAYNIEPTQKLIDSIVTMGYKVFVNDLDNNFSSLKNATLLKIDTL